MLARAPVANPYLYYFLGNENVNKSIHFYLFTGGNPAAVCLLDKDLPDEIKQKLAMEMNLSETAFLVPLDDVTGGDIFKVGKRFSLRWFTPTTEVPLCGHATLASAAVLFYVIGNQQVLILFFINRFLFYFLLTGFYFISY